ncbi:CmpA/NrtA family ABC transporter substrate-binding protein [Reyranella sp.]|uniref:CmpA/NrtA family ABC transporter substrate-binding protein n=1 Tax=Reyranella sp. TaxID=1929291 RepID=UPI003BAA61DF
MSDLERPTLTMGIIPLVDCAPIVLAEELGAFERHGLQVEIRREASWATIRDKVALGLLDAAQMLAPMPLAATLGVDGVNVPMVASMILDLNGDAITLSQSLCREIEEAAPDLAGDNLAEGAALDARALAAVVRRRAAEGRAPVALASVFPFSCHNYLLRLWLASGGIDPDRDVRLSVVPPPHMVAHLSGQVIDGYCVGEPWNQQAASLGLGRIAVSGPQIWKAMPEKVLGTTEAWAADHPRTLAALIRALVDACAWLEEPANRAEAARVLASPRYVNAPAEVIARSLALPDFHIFHRGDANFPWRSHADWFLAQMVRWEQAPARGDLAAVADRVFRPDLYRAAVAELGIACPAADRLPAGGHGEPAVPPAVGLAPAKPTASNVR